MHKPAKPYPEFPLWPNPNGQWCKKINGKPRYFGVWADPQAALEKYLKEVDHWQADQIPPTRVNTVANLLDAFLGDKQARLEEGSLVQSTFDEYQATCDVINAAIGSRPLESLSPEDFRRLREALGQGKTRAYSPHTLKRRLTVARMVFALGAEWGYTLRYRKGLKALPSWSFDRPNASAGNGCTRRPMFASWSRRPGGI